MRAELTFCFNDLWHALDVPSLLIMLSLCGQKKVVPSLEIKYKIPIEPSSFVKTCLTNASGKIKLNSAHEKSGNLTRAAIAAALLWFGILFVWTMSD